MLSLNPDLCLTIIIRSTPPSTCAVYYWNDRLKGFMLAEFSPDDVPNWAKNFLNILTMDDVWFFLQGPAMQLFVNEWYNGNEFKFEEKGMILSYNRVLGGVRMRQVRVRPGTCEVKEEYKSIIKYCYGKHSSSNEDMSGFGPVMNAEIIADISSYEFAYDYLYYNESATPEVCFQRCMPSCTDEFADYSPDKYINMCAETCDRHCGCISYNHENIEQDCPHPKLEHNVDMKPEREFKYTFRTQAELKELPFNGFLQTYGGGGYVQDLPLNLTEASEIIQVMKKERFLDLGTRLLTFDFTVYNSYLRLYNVIRMSMEFPATGGVIPKMTFLTVNIER
jgi:hypothetical protein